MSARAITRRTRRLFGRPVDSGHDPVWAAEQARMQRLNASEAQQRIEAQAQQVRLQQVETGRRYRDALEQEHACVPELVALVEALRAEVYKATEPGVPMPLFSQPPDVLRRLSELRDAAEGAQHLHAQTQQARGNWQEHWS